MADESENMVEPKQTLFPILGSGTQTSTASGSLLFPCASFNMEERAAGLGKGTTGESFILPTVEPRFNEVPRDWGNLFVISRVRYIENLHITNLWKDNQNVRYIEV